MSIAERLYQIHNQAFKVEAVLARLDELMERIDTGKPADEEVVVLSSPIKRLASPIIQRNKRKILYLARTHP
uniref:DNA topoisomerase (ATP-hydrolyzing) n=1 Tax=Panagrellus redivivus TaxID=6233 RepID=A0A7E4ZWP9_PANRE